MDNEVKLEQTIKIEQFDGPFHVLVEMLEKEKLDITEVSLSKVAEQYLAAINSQSKFDPYALADFLVVSSKLLYMKSKILLPMLTWGDDEDSGDLEDQLKLYKKYFDASKVITGMINEHNFSYVRERLAVDVEILFNPPHNLSVVKMKEVMSRVIEGIEPIVRVPKKIIRKTVLIRDKINHIRELIMNKVTANFSDLLANSKDKSEAIVTFLAMLELAKQRQIVIDQEVLHGEITLRSFKP